MQLAAIKFHFYHHVVLYSSIVSLQIVLYNVIIFLFNNKSLMSCLLALLIASTIAFTSLLTEKDLGTSCPPF